MSRPWFFMVFQSSHMARTLILIWHRFGLDDFCIATMFFELMQNGIWCVIMMDVVLDKCPGTYLALSAVVGRLVFAASVEAHLDALRFDVLELRNHMLERLQQRVPFK